MKRLDNRPAVHLRQLAGRWQMKIPSSNFQAARQWRYVPDWPGLDAFVATCWENGYRVEREATFMWNA